MNQSKQKKEEKDQVIFKDTPKKSLEFPSKTRFSAFFSNFFKKKIPKIKNKELEINIL